VLNVKHIVLDVVQLLKKKWLYSIRFGTHIAKRLWVLSSRCWWKANWLNQQEVIPKLHYHF